MRQLYRVTFIKNLVDGSGHPVNVAQGSIEVSARSRERAVDEARRAFAEIQDIKNWSMRADYLTIELLLPSNRISIVSPIRIPIESMA